ncbi:hypothetical protein ABT160_28520 [Streptomyces sp. NPDC001941]|uniref:hypothetical protein n=1 Tax=Streptomyces sp. NPDC001941 TaxID=3154659 RepID=UPI00332A92A8
MPRALLPPLPLQQQRVAALLLQGCSNAQISEYASLAPATVTSYVKGIRQHVSAPPRCSRGVLAHLLLAAGFLTPPEPPVPGITLTRDEQLLVHAIARYSKPLDQRAAFPDTSRRAFRERIVALMAKVGARDQGHLVAIVHALGQHEAAAAGNVRAAPN